MIVTLDVSWEAVLLQQVSFKVVIAKNISVPLEAVLLFKSTRSSKLMLDSPQCITFYVDKNVELISY